MIGVTLLVTFGCTARGPGPGQAPRARAPSARHEPLPATVTGELAASAKAAPPTEASPVSEQRCDGLGATLSQPSLEYVDRPKTVDGEPNGPFVGMVWEAARPLGLPAVSLDGHTVVHWVNGAEFEQGAPDYTRELVVTEVDSGPTNHSFRLLEHAELLRALPDGESPSAAAIQLANRRLTALSARVRRRVTAANAWLGARRWAPITECVADRLGHVRTMRIGELRVSVNGLAIEIRRDAGGAPLRREDIDLSGHEACFSELRLVSISVAETPRVLLVVAAPIPISDDCFARNEVRAYRLSTEE